MRRKNNYHVIARDDNVVRVDFSREPDPPAPKFPGANGLREFRERDGDPNWPNRWEILRFPLGFSQRAAQSLLRLRSMGATARNYGGEFFKVSNVGPRGFFAGSNTIRLAES